MIRVRGGSTHTVSHTDREEGATHNRTFWAWKEGWSSKDRLPQPVVHHYRPDIRINRSNCTLCGPSTQRPPSSGSRGVLGVLLTSGLDLKYF